jgi:hypothetical protein
MLLTIAIAWIIISVLVGMTPRRFKAGTAKNAANELITDIETYLKESHGRY